MEFFESVFDTLARTFDFRGRSSREDFWWFVLFNFLASAVGFSITMMNALGGGPGAMILPAGIALWWLLMLIPSLSLTVRRFHDMDRTGWWVLLGLIPSIGWLVLLVWCSLPGTPGSNRFDRYAPSSVPAVRRDDQ